MSSVDDVVYLWHEGVYPPLEMHVSQVYGYVFDDQGRVTVLRNDSMWNLPGGTPEPTDENQVATLAREVHEEVQVEIADPVYLGFQEVRRRGANPYAQLRMAARAIRFLDRTPDPDKGQVHVRRRCSMSEALALLDWGPVVEEQAKAATCVAEARWHLPMDETVSSYTD